MSGSPVIAAIAAVTTFAVLMVSQPISAQWASQYVSGYALRAPRPQGVVPVKEEGFVTPPKCRSKPFKYSVTYPRGIDGGGSVDRASAAIGRRLLAQAKEEGRGYMGSGYTEYCDTDGYFIAASSPLRISDSAYSVLFSYDYYTGGNHAYTQYVAMNLMYDGSGIVLGNLFPSTARSLPLVRDAVYRRLCVAGAGSRNSNDRPSCLLSSSGLLQKLGESSGSLASDGHMTLSSLGLSLHFDTGDLSSLAAGPQFMDISKDELIRMGADPAVWR